MNTKKIVTAKLIGFLTFCVLGITKDTLAQYNQIGPPLYTCAELREALPRVDRFGPARIIRCEEGVDLGRPGPGGKKWFGVVATIEASSSRDSLREYATINSRFGSWLYWDGAPSNNGIRLFQNEARLNGINNLCTGEIHTGLTCGTMLPGWSNYTQEDDPSGWTGGFTARYTSTLSVELRDDLSPTPTITPPPSSTHTPGPSPTPTPDPTCDKKRALWNEFEECRSVGIRTSREGRKKMPEEYSYPGRNPDEASSALMQESTINSSCGIKDCSRGMEQTINDAQKIANKFRRGLIQCTDSKGITEDLEENGYLPFDYNLILNKKTFPWWYGGGFHKPLRKSTRFNLVSDWISTKNPFPLAESNFCGRVIFANYGKESRGKGHVYLNWCNCNPDTFNQTNPDRKSVECFVAEAASSRTDPHPMIVTRTNMKKLFERFKKDLKNRPPMHFTVASRGQNTDPRDGDACFDE